MWVSTNRNGVCNRIKSLVSALMLDPQAKVLWKRTKKANCSFSDIFANDVEVDSVPEGARVYNSWRFCLLMDGVLQVPEDDRIATDFLYERTDPALKDRILEAIGRLRFQPSLVKRAEELSIPRERASVQIRSWHEVPDHPRARTYRLENYFEAVEALPPVPLFVTADCNAPVREMRRRYNKRVIVSPGRWWFGRRTTRRGMRNIMIDFIRASRSPIIVGDAESTFTEMSWWFGGAQARMHSVRTVS